LPNISFALAEELRRVGITTPRQLRGLGAEESWNRLRGTGRHDCIHSLLALGGAILGITWQGLPAERRFELMRFAAHALSGPAPAPSENAARLRCAAA
jgi:DNA transformation protein